LDDLFSLIYAPSSFDIFGTWHGGPGTFDDDFSVNSQYTRIYRWAGLKLQDANGQWQSQLPEWYQGTWPKKWVDANL
jgi:hypothetical protein